MMQGADVINLSLGFSAGWSEDVVAVVAARIVAAGTVVVSFKRSPLPPSRDLGSPHLPSRSLLLETAALLDCTMPTLPRPVSA